MVARTGRAAGGFFSEFQEFALKGNVIDLAVAVIIGGAFGKIIESFVADIITPAILSPALKAANVDNLQSLSANGIKYGSFLAAVINFFVIAFCLFVLIRSFEQTKKKMSRQAAIDEVSGDPVDPVLQSQERLTTAIDRLTQTMQTR
jgi:large conductance mechanosensitive channel